MRYDFKDLKKRVSVLDVLRAYRLHENLREQGGELVGPCPLPGHGGDRSNKGAFRVTASGRGWHCLTHCGGGDVVALVRAIEGCDCNEAAHMLDRIGGGAVLDSPRSPRPPAVAIRQPFEPYTKTLRLDPSHPLLTAKGITPSTAAAFEAGWWPLGGFLDGCVGVRLHDLVGRPIGYAGRRVDWPSDDDAPKWRLPARFPKSELLFNWHRARPHLDRGVVVVEGPWDAIKVTQAGIPAVVALLGHDVSRGQVALLMRAPKVIVMLDGDEAGREGTRKLVAALGEHPVEVVTLPDGADPADLSDEELRALLACSFPSPVPPCPRDR